MTFTLPPIVKQAERVLVEIEQAASRFPRRFKYTVGADLRKQAMEVCRIAHRAWRDRGRQAEWVSRLVFAVDDLKITLQLGSRIQAFASFAQFEMLARLVSDLGKQAGGWNRQQHPKGQNAGAGNASQQRVQILSTRAASNAEANA
jgi:hypothetical protein